MMSPLPTPSTDELVTADQFNEAIAKNGDDGMNVIGDYAGREQRIYEDPSSAEEARYVQMSHQSWRIGVPLAATIVDDDEEWDALTNATVSKSGGDDDDDDDDDLAEVLATHDDCEDDGDDILQTQIDDFVEKAVYLLNFDTKFQNMDTKHAIAAVCLSFVNLVALICAFSVCDLCIQCL